LNFNPLRSPFEDSFETFEILRSQIRVIAEQLEHKRERTGAIPAENVAWLCCGLFAGLADGARGGFFFHEASGELIWSRVANNRLRINVLEDCSIMCYASLSWLQQSHAYFQM
jgi:hypothetical protein